MRREPANGYTRWVIITVSGENEFGRSSELKALVDKFVTENGELALEKIDGEETEYNRISEALTSLPFLANKKLVVFKDASANKDFAEKFEPLLKGLPETTELVLAEAKLDKRTSLYKYLKKFSDFREFSKLDAGALVKWLVERASAVGGEISSSDARYLVDRAGENQQKLAKELDKLLTHSLKISRADIDLLVEPMPQSKVFDLLDVAFAGNAKRAMALYQEQRALKVAPQEIIAMLAWQLHLLALAKTGSGISPRQIASDAKISPYSIEKSANLARRLELTQIKQYVSDLVELDERLKSSPLDADEALKSYLLGLTQ